MGGVHDGRGTVGGVWCFVVFGFPSTYVVVGTFVVCFPVSV